MNDKRKLLIRGMEVFKSGQYLFQKALNDLEHCSTSLALQERNDIVSTSLPHETNDLKMLSEKLNEVSGLIKEFSIFQVSLEY